MNLLQKQDLPNIPFNSLEKDELVDHLQYTPNARAAKKISSLPDSHFIDVINSIHIDKQAQIVPYLKVEKQSWLLRQMGSPLFSCIFLRMNILFQEDIFISFKDDDRHELARYLPHSLVESLNKGIKHSHHLTI